ncbi:conserved hypothetical protein, partial [Trichinella spiralis]|uniref:hypothetical protein n=1 Tax=Trichinella spiralis TaxID=6334 RepID=UPI0001EFD602
MHIFGGTAVFNLRSAVYALTRSVISHGIFEISVRVRCRLAIVDRLRRTDRPLLVTPVETAHAVFAAGPAGSESPRIRSVRRQFGGEVDVVRTAVRLAVLLGTTFALPDGPVVHDHRNHHRLADVGRLGEISSRPISSVGVVFDHHRRFEIISTRFFQSVQLVRIVGFVVAGHFCRRHRVDRKSTVLFVH